MHAAGLIRPIPKAHLEAIATFLRQTFYARFAVTTDRHVSLPLDLRPMQPVVELLKRYVVQLAAYTPFQSMALVFESSTRADTLLQKYFGELSIQQGRRSIPVQHCLMPKRASEPGLEAADLIANIAGSMAQWRFGGRPGFPKDFQAGFQGVPDSRCRYMHISGVTATADRDEVAGVELKEPRSTDVAAGPDRSKG